jgi:hypothetical protein
MTLKIKTGTRALKKGKETLTSQNIHIPLEHIQWQDPGEMPSYVPTHALTMIAVGQIHLTFYELLPPFAERDRRGILSAKGMTRVVLSPEFARQVIVMLQDALQETPEREDGDVP